MSVRYPGVACYWLEPNERGRVILRRFTFSNREANPCPESNGGHDASVTTTIEAKLPWRKDKDGHMILWSPPDKIVPPRSSKKWPRTCEHCGEKFPRGAEWQASWAEGFERSDTGETVWFRHHMGKEAAGSLFHVRWYEGPAREWHDVRDRGDGIVLGAVCPNGLLWVVDAKATGGGHWERSGDPRRPETLTVTPSIRAGDYHGFLQSGRFTDDLGS